MQCQIAILKIAETVEPLTSNQQVVGPSPPGIAMFQWVARKDQLRGGRVSTVDQAN